MKLSNIKKVRGQGMSEYLVLVAMIAVLSIAVLGLFGNSARNMIASAGSTLSGDQTQAELARAAAQEEATAANTEGDLRRGMGEFQDVNDY